MFNFRLFFFFFFPDCKKTLLEHFNCSIEYQPSAKKVIFPPLLAYSGLGKIPSQGITGNRASGQNYVKSVTSPIN